MAHPQKSFLVEYSLEIEQFLLSVDMPEKKQQLGKKSHRKSDIVQMYNDMACGHFHWNIALVPTFNHFDIQFIDTKKLALVRSIWPY